MSKATLDKIRWPLLYAVLLTLAMALAFGIAGMVSAPDAEAHDMSCGWARTYAKHPNAYCQRVSANAIDLYFPWRTCQERVAYTSHGSFPWYEHRGTVAHCSGWH